MSAFLKTLSAILLLAISSIVAVAQDPTTQAKIAGSWMLVDENLVFPDGKTIKSWGPSPYGYLNFDGKSHFSMMLIRSDLPKFETRTSGTQDQNNEIAKGAIAYFGAYSSDDANGSITLFIAGSTFAAFNGIASTRKVSIDAAGLMTIRMEVPNSKVVTNLVWQRVK